MVRYLASSRALSRSFDVYLQQVLYPCDNGETLTDWRMCVSLQLIRVLSEPEVRMRTRAMKALSCIIDSDPSILSRVYSPPLYLNYCANTVSLLSSA